MKSKLIDAEQVAELSRRKKNKERKRLEGLLGKGTTRCRNLIRRLKKKADAVNEKAADKNKCKVSHLTKEYGNEYTRRP